MWSSESETSDDEESVLKFGPFPFVRLPTVLIDESLKTMKIKELIELSSTSKNMRKITSRHLRNQNLHLNVLGLHWGAGTISLQKGSKVLFEIRVEHRYKLFGVWKNKLIRETNWNFGQETANVKFHKNHILSNDVEPITSFFLTFATSCSIESEAINSVFMDKLFRAARNFPLQKCSAAHSITAEELNGLVNVCEGQIDGLKGSSGDLNAFLKQWMRKTTPFYKFSIKLKQIDMEHVLDQIEVKAVDKPMGLNEGHHQHGVSQWYEMTRDDNFTVLVYNYGSTFEMVNKDRI
ncbi:unnamed protein product [Caenorhabditis nigoni]